MTILNACGDLSANSYLGLSRPRPWWHAFCLWTVLAAGQLFAQSASANDGSIYLEKYAKQLALLQEARFSFSGQFTRSTPKLGLVATWETAGAVRVSAKRKSFHWSGTTTLTKATGAKTPMYLGIHEQLITPTVFLDVAIQADESPAKSENQFSVDAKTTSSDDEWAKQIGRNEFGILLGYVTSAEDGKSLLAVARGAPSEPLADKASDLKSLAGFLVKHEAMEIRALFDPSIDPLAKHVRISRAGATNKIGDVVKADVTVLSVAYADAKPVKMTVKITLERAGGIIKEAELPKSPGAKRAETIEIEPQTWSYDYEIKDIQHRDDRGDWFALDHPIPNETPVVLDDDQSSQHVWRDGKVHKLGIDDFKLLVSREKIGEVAADRAETADESRPAIRPLSERLVDVVRSVRPCGMHCLVILEGDFVPGSASARSVNLEHPYLLPYLPLVLNPDAIRANTSTLESLGWPRPQAGEVVLVAVNGDAKTLGKERLKLDKASDANNATKLATAFLKKHSPAVRDARTQLAVARTEADRTDRKVCVVVSGVRCGPCFRLARWIDTQHALLDKDYVMVKVMVEVDSHAREVVNTLHLPPEGGVPCFAITDAEGKVLVTSEGPKGNIGMPSSPEEIRHLREMLAKTANRLTVDEIDGLVKSLVDFK